MPGDYKNLLIGLTPEGVCTITLNRPERLNAVNLALSNEIPAAIDEVSSSDEVRVIVITGAGRGFCAGLDLNPDNLEARTENRNRSIKDKLDPLGWVGRQALAMINSPKPIIAAINGPAAGAGFGLTLGADIRLMKAGAVVTTGYARRGLSPDAGVTYFLPRLVGASRAAELILTGRDISAEEAERIGLATRVLPAEDFSGQVMEYAAKLAAGAPIGLALTKRLLASSPTATLEEQLKSEYLFIQKCFTTEDVAEAVKAYQEKRQPNFKGR